MIAALLLALAPQDPYDVHLRNVHLERHQALLAAWEVAAEPRRALVRDAFRARRSRGVPAVYQVSAQHLTELTRVLEGAADAINELSWEQRFACSLDLHVLPGAFTAGAGGRGDEVIVRVLPAMTRLFEPLPEEVLLRLVWVGPDGQEIPARQEPVHRHAFRMPGFEMYLRAPGSSPGRWHLVPEVEREGRIGRGFPVPVDCVRDLFGRADRRLAAPAEDPSHAAAHEALTRRLHGGFRNRMAPPIGALLDGALLPPLLSEGAEWAGAETLRLDAGPQQPRELVLVVAPALEEPDWVFAGAALEAWVDLAVGRHAWVFTTALPIRDPTGADVLGVLEGLRAALPDVPLTLVVRGPSVGRLSLALLGKRGALPFDRVVVNTVLPESAAPQRQFEAPTLLVAPLSEDAPLERVPGDGPPLHWLKRADPPLVVAPALGAHVRGWLDALDSL